jgi:hypothetical protein
VAAEYTGVPFGEPGIAASGADGWIARAHCPPATVIARLAMATIVGNKHGNQISGTAHRDVIVAPACPGPMRFVT